MRTTLHLAAVLLLTAATAAARAQITNPDDLIGHPPKPPAHRQPQPTTGLDWLWSYTQPAPHGDKPNLLADPRFINLLHDDLSAPQSFWGLPGTPLAEAASTFLSGPGAVASTDNRHLTITGAVPDQPAQRGLLWVDLSAAPKASPQRPTPLIVFSALRWNEQARTPLEPGAPFTLWIFPSRELDAHDLPTALKTALGTFTAQGGCSAPIITAAIVVDPGGAPHILGAIDAGIVDRYCPASTSPATPSHPSGVQP